MAQFRPGVYSGTYLESLVEETTKGTPYISLLFEINFKMEGGQWHEVSPATRGVRLFLSEKAMPYTLQTLEPLGFNNNLMDPKFSVYDVDKAPQELHCDHETNDSGQSFENWKLPYERKSNPVDRSTATTLQARLNALTGGAKGAPPPPPPPPRKQPAPPIPHDDNDDMCEPDGMPF